MIPTLVVYLQLINAHDAIQNNTLNLIFMIGLLISLSAAVIQFIADKQMYDIRMKPNKDKKVIDSVAYGNILDIPIT